MRDLIFSRSQFDMEVTKLYLFQSLQSDITLSACNEEHLGFWLRGNCIGCLCFEGSGERA